MNLRLDSLSPSAGAFFERDLRFVRKEIIEDQRPPLNAFTLIPQATDIPAYADSYEHRMYEMIGVADFIADYAQDQPNVDIAARNELFNAREFGCAYQYSISEIEKSAALDYQLDRKRALSARIAIEEKFNRIQFFGDTGVQLFGWVNYPYIPRRIVSFPFDSTSSTVNILAELNAAINQPFLQTRTSGHADTLVMAPELMTFLEATPWSVSSSGATDRTIMEQFLATNSRVSEVKAAQELSFAGPDGEHLMIAYRKDEMIFSHKMMRPFTQLAPQDRNMAIITNCHAKSGGIACDRPLEMVIVEVPVS
jgi:hypothetical protein